MATVRIPGPLRTLSQGEAAVQVEAGDLRGAIEQLESRFPGFRERVLDPSGNLRQFVNVYLNDEDVRFGGGLDVKLEPKDEVSIIPAVAGGRPLH
ncbi:MAG: MoaD/ThiS family protein [Chloroflexi bacterium]|nr:MAG: MoaD/ThiS family protein [Chloroflexota bacterium]TMD51136.1 MAG: MoaD/ThiS family protein [Chloroflexota bacterium]